MPSSTPWHLSSSRYSFHLLHTFVIPQQHSQDQRCRQVHLWHVCINCLRRKLKFSSVIPFQKKEEIIPVDFHVQFCYSTPKVFLSLRLKQKSCVSGQPPWKLLCAAARSSAASPAPPQPWKAALAGSLPSSAGTFLGKTCEVKQHTRTHCSPRENPPSKAKTQYKLPRKDPSKPARLS
mgnify:CR=1 FL=1